MEKILSDIPVNLHERALARYMGYPVTSGESEERRAMIRSHMKRFSALIRPKGVYGIFPFQASGSYLILADQDLQFHSAFLAKKFGSSGTLGVFVVTAGDGVTEMTGDLMREGRLPEALVLDAAASAAVDQAARHIHRELQEALGARLVRYSPGYDEQRYGWSLSDLKVIFELLIPERIGIRLMPGFTMKPDKSVSAVAGRPFRI